MLKIECLDKLFVREKLIRPGRKSGKDHFNHCPRHQDRTPSLSVNYEMNCFHCFSCRACGNAWEYCAFVLGLRYPEDKDQVHAYLRSHGLISSESFYSKKTFNAVGKKYQSPLDQTKPLTLERIMGHMGDKLMYFSGYPLLFSTFRFLESVILSKIDYMLTNYNRATWECSISGFLQLFPFTSESSIRRAIKKLETLGVLRELQNGRGRIAWSIDYDVLAELIRTKNMRVYILSNTASRRRNVSA